jgi:hypothetical protein
MIHTLYTPVKKEPRGAQWIFANPDTGKPYWPGRIQENWLVPAAEKVRLGRIGWHTFQRCFLRWVSMSRCSRNSCDMQMFERL